jgi:hypothetical protein
MPEHGFWQEKISRLQERQDWVSSAPTFYNGNIYVGWDKMHAFGMPSVNMDIAIRELKRLSTVNILAEVHDDIDQDKPDSSAT